MNYLMKNLESLFIFGPYFMIGLCYGIIIELDNQTQQH